MKRFLRSAHARGQKTASFFSDFSELKPGDYVVHVDHGIGQFEGLRQESSKAPTGEFMFLRYADDARLYVPLARLDLVQKYQSLDGAEPALDRLGTHVWEARKTRVRKSVNDMADSFLSCTPSARPRPDMRFRPTRNWQREFEDAFEFEETPDQQRAIADVKRDMESTQPMDRLLCGDVGYGKTEVAMRAAFKAVCGRQAGRGARAHHGAGVPAFRNFPPPLRGVSGAHRNAQPLSHRQASRRKFWQKWKPERWTSSSARTACFPRT